MSAKTMSSKKPTTKILLLIMFIIIIISLIFLIIFKDNSIYVSFDTKGGSNITKVIVDENGKIEEPIPPVKNNYIFNGWYLDITLDNYADIKELKFKENTTLYAAYSEYFDFDFFTNFYESYLYDLNNERINDSSLKDFVNSNNITTFTSSVLVSYLGDIILNSSTNEVYELLSNENKELNIRENLKYIYCDVPTYFYNEKEYCLVNNEYINANDVNDVIGDVENSDQWYRTDLFYKSKDNTKVYIKIIKGDTSKYINVLDSSDENYIEALDELSFVGKLGYYNNTFYVDYNPDVSGYKKTDFLEYFDSCMEYYLFLKPYNNYFTYQYERLMLEVYYEINPNKKNYKESILDKNKKIVSTIYRNFIDFEDYNDREDKIDNDNYEGEM